MIIVLAALVIPDSSIDSYVATTKNHFEWSKPLIITCLDLDTYM